MHINPVTAECGERIRQSEELAKLCEGEIQCGKRLKRWVGEGLIDHT